jgi:hypothetical protein
MAQVRMTRTNIIDSVRAITEMDASDVSDAVLQLYMRDGYNRIIDLERRWNFLEVSFTMNTVTNQQAYTINDYTAYDMREVISILDTDNARLNYISYDVAEEQFLITEQEYSDPLFYSMWADQIHLFPTPSSVIPLTIRGYRTPDDWVTNNTTVDGPDAFDIPLVYYVVSRVYQAQEEAQTASIYERSFSDAIALARRDLTRPPSATPTILAGGPRIRRWKGTDWSSLT